jgi:hypothetical protein
MLWVMIIKVSKLNLGDAPLLSPTLGERLNLHWQTT